MTKIIEMAFDEMLLAQVDETAKQLQVSRTDFVRRAIEDALRANRIKRLEENHIASYNVHPQSEEEISEWDDIRDWGVILNDSAQSTVQFA